MSEVVFEPLAIGRSPFHGGPWQRTNCEQVRWVKALTWKTEGGRFAVDVWEGFGNIGDEPAAASRLGKIRYFRRADLAAKWLGAKGNCLDVKFPAVERLKVTHE